MTEEDSIAVLVGNLPPDVHEDDLHDAFEGLGYELDIKLVREGNEERVTAVVRFDGITRGVAEQLAQQINGRISKGRELKAYVPLFMK